MAADLRSTMQATIDSFVEDHTQAVKRRDPKLLSASLADDCVRIYRPLSFVRRYPQFFPKSQLTNAEFEEQLRGELRTMQDASQDVTRIVLDVEGRKASLTIEKTVFSALGGKNVIEAHEDLDFSEDGTRITQIIEFVDTHQSGKFLEEILSNMPPTQ